MGRLRVHGAATADALLVVAERLVETEGVNAVTVRRVAEEAGTTTRAIYSTFGTKDALLAALGIRAFELLGAFVRRVALTDDPAADLVRVGAIAFRDFARRHTGLFRIGFDPVATPPQIWSEVAQVNAQAWQALLARIERLGLGRPIEPLALQFHALCEGLAVNELRGTLGSPRAAKALWRQALTALVSGWTGTAAG
ncbi:MAG: TetR/AcrR family transcriptional regulator [Jatrophihabitans sp.]|uniref:TetR/AcrR family transcriptional regulator n=1 Tax=Jatrophihabitans sp. TaxID=1932789 RepID=UPI00390D0435